MADTAPRLRSPARGTTAVQEIDEARLGARLAAQAEVLLRQISRRIPDGLRRSVSPEDVLQDVWSTAFRDFARVTLVGPNALDRWITTIANRRLIDEIRRARRLKRGGSMRIIEEDGALRSSFLSLFERISEPGQTPSSELSAKEVTVAVRAALESLPQDRRRAIWLRHIEGRTPAEVAKAMNKTPSAVRSLVYHGLHQLRGRLGPASSFFSDAASSDPAAREASERDCRKA